jgi:hypothetical protein
MLLFALRFLDVAMLGLPLEAHRQTATGFLIPPEIRKARFSMVNLYPKRACLSRKISALTILSFSALSSSLCVLGGFWRCA